MHQMQTCQNRKINKFRATFGRGTRVTTQQESLFWRWLMALSLKMRSSLNMSVWPVEVIPLKITRACSDWLLKFNVMFPFPACVTIFRPHLLLKRPLQCNINLICLVLGLYPDKAVFYNFFESLSVVIWAVIIKSEKILAVLFITPHPSCFCV